MTDTDHKSQLDAMLEELPAVRPVVAERILRAAYQTELGIYDHQTPDPERPMAVVAMHPAENVVEGGMYYSYVRKFHAAGINDAFGLSLTEFFELEWHAADLLLEIVDSSKTKGGGLTAKDLKDLEKDLKK